MKQDGRPLIGRADPEEWVTHWTDDDVAASDELPSVGDEGELEPGRRTRVRCLQRCLAGLERVAIDSNKLREGGEDESAHAAHARERRCVRPNAHDLRRGEKSGLSGV